MSLFGSILGGLTNIIKNPLDSATGSLSGGLLPAGLNQLGDNFLNGYMGYYFNNRAAEDANNRMISFWNMQNAYNTPKEQMKRFAEAGLNPNLIYGQSNVAGAIGRPAVASFSNSAHSVDSRPFDILNALQVYYGLQNVKAQNSLIASQKSVADANARRMNYETNWLQKHNTSSFDNSVVRAGKSLLEYAQPVADLLGNAAGTLVGSFHSGPRLVSVGDNFPSRRQRLNSWSSSEGRWRAVYR